MAIIERGALELGDALPHTAGIALVGDDDLRSLGKLRSIRLQLVVDDAIVLKRVATLETAADIDDVQDERGALDVAEELVSKATSLACALDEAGDVGDDVGVVARADDAQIGHEGGERIIGDLGARGAHARDKGGFPDAGHADESGVGHELHLELDPMLQRGLALLGERRGSTGRRDEMGVAPAAAAAGCDDDALAIMGEVGDLVRGLHGLRIDLSNDGTHGNLKDQILSVLSILASALAMRAALGAEMVLESVVDKRRELGVGLDDDVTAATAVAAVGPALGNERLAAEGHASGSAVAALDVDTADVGELGHRDPFSIWSETTSEDSKRGPWLLARGLPICLCCEGT